VFYSFSYLLREIVRLYSITEKYDIWVLSDQEMNFYNLFFAYLSLIFAQSFCLSQWFNRTRKPFEKVNLSRKAIQNEQRFLNFVFVYWFSQLALLYALFIGIISPGFYVFSFYPEYNFLFILMLIVLFSYTWITIIRVYKRKAFKWMLFSAILISVLAFAFSRINLVNYHKINEMVLEKNIAHKYKLELAETNTFDWYFYRYLGDIYLVNPSDTAESKEPLILFHNHYSLDDYGKELAFDEFEQNLLNYIKSREKYSFSPNSFAILYIDKSIKMLYVKRLQKILADVGFYRIGYAVIPKDREEYDKRFYTDYFSAWHLMDSKTQENMCFIGGERLSVRYVNDSIEINSVACSPKDFYSKIRHEIGIRDER